MHRSQAACTGHVTPRAADPDRGHYGTVSHLDAELASEVPQAAVRTMTAATIVHVGNRMAWYRRHCRAVTETRRTRLVGHPVLSVTPSCRSPRLVGHPVLSVTPSCRSPRLVGHPAAALACCRCHGEPVSDAEGHGVVTSGRWPRRCFSVPAAPYSPATCSATSSATKNLPTPRSCCMTSTLNA